MRTRGPAPLDYFLIANSPSTNINQRAQHLHTKHSSDKEEKEIHQNTDAIACRIIAVVNHGLEEELIQTTVKQNKSDLPRCKKQPCIQNSL